MAGRRHHYHTIFSQWRTDGCHWWGLVCRQGCWECHHPPSHPRGSASICYSREFTHSFDIKIFIVSYQFYAKGGDDGPEYNQAHRLVNAWEFAKLSRQAAELGRYVIAVRHYSMPMVIPLVVSRQEISMVSRAALP